MKRTPNWETIARDLQKLKNYTDEETRESMEEMKQLYKEGGDEAITKLGWWEEQHWVGE